MSEIVGGTRPGDWADDAAKWADAFRKTAINLGYSDMDEGWLIGWFANAIEISHDHRMRAKSKSR